MNFANEYLKAMESLRDHVMKNDVGMIFPDSVIYSFPGEDGEYAIRVVLKRYVSHICVYTIEISSSCIPNIKSMHMRELRKLKLVVSNKNMTHSIYLHTRIVGKQKYTRKLYGIHIIPIEFKNCVFEPSAKAESGYITSDEITMTNCEIMK